MSDPPPDLSPVSVGLGLDYGTVALSEARPEWGLIARRLADEIRIALGENAAQIEHVGSTAVPGLATKPIIDLVAGVNRATVEAVRGALEDVGYQYRGDAGEHGGLVFVLDDRPHRRVAHLHVVDYRAPQLQRYLAFRDLLMRDATARSVYTRRKLDLAKRFPRDRKAYQAGKDSIVLELLELDAQREPNRARRRIDTEDDLGRLLR